MTDPKEDGENNDKGCQTAFGDVVSSKALTAREWPSTEERPFISPKQQASQSSDAAGNSIFARIPPELYMIVTSLLEEHDLANLAVTCCRFYDLSLRTLEQSFRRFNCHSDFWSNMDTRRTAYLLCRSYRIGCLVQDLHLIVWVNEFGNPVDQLRFLDILCATAQAKRLSIDFREYGEEKECLKLESLLGLLKMHKPLSSFPALLVSLSFGGCLPFQLFKRMLQSIRCLKSFTWFPQGDCQALGHQAWHELWQSLQTHTSRTLEVLEIRPSFMGEKMAETTWIDSLKPFEKLQRIYLPYHPRHSPLREVLPPSVVYVRMGLQDYTSDDLLHKTEDVWSPKLAGAMLPNLEYFLLDVDYCTADKPWSPTMITLNSYAGTKETIRVHGGLQAIAHATNVFVGYALLEYCHNPPIKSITNDELARLDLDS